MAECDRLQLGQSVVAAGATEGNRNVVVDQLATAVGETYPLLLVLLAESHVIRRLFASTVRRIEALPLPTG